MNRHALITAAVLTALLTLPAHAATGVMFKDGTVCDPHAGFCADSTGISTALTGMYLGADAERKLVARIHDAGPTFDATRFTMSGGLTCWTSEHTCWTDRLRQKPHARANAELFKH